MLAAYSMASLGTFIGTLVGLDPVLRHIGCWLSARSYIAVRQRWRCLTAADPAFIVDVARITFLFI